MIEQYKCYLCQGVFYKEWSDEEAEKELNEKYPNIPKELTVVVCEDCYNTWVNKK